MSSKSFTKKLVVPAIVLGGLAAGLPAIQQSCVTAEYRELLEKINSEQGAVSSIPFVLTEVSTNAGYANSEIITRLTTPLNPNVCLEFKSVVTYGVKDYIKGNLHSSVTTLLNESIDGGCNMLSDIESAPEAKKLIQKMFEKGSPLVINSASSLLGSSSMILNTKALDIELSDKRSVLRLKSSPFTANVTYDNDMKNIQSEYQMAELHISKDDRRGSFDLSFGPLTAHADISREGFSKESQLWKGPAEFNVKDLSITVDGNVFDLRSVDISMLLDEKDGLFSEKVATKLKTMKFNNHDLGSLSFDFAVNDLKTAAIDALSSQLPNAAHDIPPTAMLGAKEVQGHVKDMLNNASISISPLKWSFDDSEKVAQLVADLSLKFVDLVNVNPAEFANLMDALSSVLDSEVNVSIDKAFADAVSKVQAAIKMSKMPKTHQSPDVMVDLQIRAKKQFERFVSSGPVNFIEEGEKWKTRLTLNKEGLKVNGEKAMMFNPSPLAPKQ